MRNIAYEKIKDAKRLTDAELLKGMIKDGHAVTEAGCNKILLDLEILGLVTVSWVTKDERRIELVEVKKEEDLVAEQARAAEESDYEASFPGVDK